MQARVFSWRCPDCHLRVLPERRDRGLIFVSPFTAYAEAFLFELAVNLSRNGCSLRSSSYLREAYNELTVAHKCVTLSHRLRSLTNLRRGLLLYLFLVIKGLPLDVSTCERCVGRDGKIDVACFDCLRLGFKVNHKKPFKRTGARTSAVPQASLHARLVNDAAAAKALGSNALRIIQDHYNHRWHARICHGHRVSARSQGCGRQGAVVCRRARQYRVLCQAGMVADHRR